MTKQQIDDVRLFPLSARVAVWTFCFGIVHNMCVVEQKACYYYGPGTKVCKLGSVHVVDVVSLKLGRCARHCRCCQFVTWKVCKELPALSV